MANAITPWWETMVLRDEIERGQGRIDDVQASLHDAVFGRAGGGDVPYHRADFYGEITHPTASLVELMAKIAIRLGVEGRHARGVWRLDQGMGGGKSHGMIGLWHLATNPTSLKKTELGRQVFEQAYSIAGLGSLAPGLGNPTCVVLDCDNPEPNEKTDGPAKTLGERFLWRLFDGAYKKWEAYKSHTSSKVRLEEALVDVGRPVLILVDEVMDYIRWASNHDDKLVLSDMAFLRSLLETVNKVNNCALVVVMIASDKDRIVLNERGKQCQEELEDLLTRNGQATTVSSGGDFADIIRRRLFQVSTPVEVTNATANLFLEQMDGSWCGAFLKAGESDVGFQDKVARSYPFHPSLIALVENEWSLNTGFQRVRSTIQVFAATVFALREQATQGEWTPMLIGTGDLPLSSRSVRDALLDSGLVADQRTQASMREVAASEIVDPDHPERSTSRRLDLQREQGWNEVNPRAAERAATALFVYSIAPRPDARRGATEAEIITATFVPVNSYGYGDAEIVFSELLRELVAYDYTEGSGPNPRRWYFETRKTPLMLYHAEKEAITDEERNEIVTTKAFDLATSKPFSSGPFSIVIVEGEGSPGSKPSFEQLKNILEGAGIDDRHKTRLVVLDSRWFSLGGESDNDNDIKEAIRAAMGIGENKLAMSWASSVVFICVDNQGRRHARGIATEYLAWERVVYMEAIQSDESQSASASAKCDQARSRLDKAVTESYQHILYLSDDGSGGREMQMISLQAKNQSALDGRAVWSALVEDDKAVDQFDSRALLHNLRDSDWGRPISELRDEFWNAPRLPLLPGGEADLRQALYQAIRDGEIVLTDADGNQRSVTVLGDINFGSSDIRIHRPDTIEDEDDDEEEEDTDTDDTPVNPNEHQVYFTLTKSLREDSDRDPVRNLLNQVVNAVDGDASYIQISLRVVVPPETKDKIVGRAEEAGISPSVNDL